MCVEFVLIFNFFALCVIFSFESEAEKIADEMLTEQEKTSMHNLIKLLSAVEEKSQYLDENINTFGSLATGHAPELLHLEKTIENSDNRETTSSPSTTAAFRTLKPLTKDTFLLPLTKPTTQLSQVATSTTAKPSTSSTTNAPTKQTTTRGLFTLADSPTVQTTAKPEVEAQLNPENTKMSKETPGASKFRFV